MFTADVYKLADQLSNHGCCMSTHAKQISSYQCLSALVIKSIKIVEDFVHRCAIDNYIVYVGERNFVVESLKDPVHQSLKSAGSADKAEGHVNILPMRWIAKWSMERCFRLRTLGKLDIVVPLLNV